MVMKNKDQTLTVYSNTYMSYVKPNFPDFPGQSQPTEPLLQGVSCSCSYSFEKSGTCLLSHTNAKAGFGMPYWQTLEKYVHGPLDWNTFKDINHTSVFQSSVEWHFVRVGRWFLICVRLRVHAAFTPTRPRPTLYKHGRFRTVPYAAVHLEEWQKDIPRIHLIQTSGFATPVEQLENPCISKKKKLKSWKHCKSQKIGDWGYQILYHHSGHSSYTT